MATEKERLERSFTGRLKCILPIYQIDGFMKLEFVVVSNEQYPKPIKFELQNDKVCLLGGYLPGDEVKLDFNLRGREWINPEGKSIYFTTFVVWRIKKIANGYIVPTKDGGQIQHNYDFKPAADVFGPQPTKSNSNYTATNDDDYDDLPF